MARPGSPPGWVPILRIIYWALFGQRVLLKRAKMLRIRAFERSAKPLIGVSSGGAALARAWCRVRNALLDHLISAQQNRWGYRKAERPGDLEVHGHLKFCILVAARRGRGNSQSKRSRSSPRPCLAYATVAGSGPGIVGATIWRRSDQFDAPQPVWCIPSDRFHF